MRNDWNPAFFNKLIFGSVVEPVAFVMGRKMLLRLNEGTKPRSARE